MDKQDSKQAFPPNPKVDAVIKNWGLDEPNSPGCSLAIAKGCKTIYARGYGMADLDHKIENTPATVFHAASLSKQFTAMSMLLLVQKYPDRISLASNVHDYISELSGVTDPITIRQMLHHTSGIRDQSALLTAAGWRLGDDVVTTDDVLGLVKRMKTTNFTPGAADFSYSNTNYFLAGQIVERVTAQIVERITGSSLAEFAHDNIFVPLQMTSTKFAQTHGEQVNNRAYGYRKIEQPKNTCRFEMTMPNYDLTGSTNLVTTVEDLLCWNRNLYSGNLGGNAALAEMLNGVPERGSFGYGLGLYLFPFPYHGDPLFVDHDGRDPGHRAHLIRFPLEKLSIALLCNVEFEGSTRDLVTDVADAISLARLKRPVAAVKGTSHGTTIASSLEDYIGQYYSDEINATYDIILDGQSLKLLRYKREPRSLQPAGADKFRIDDFAERVLKTVTVTFRRVQGGICGFIMDDATGGDRLRNFLFCKLHKTA